MVDRHHPGLAPTALLRTLSGGLCLGIDQLAERLDLTKRQVSDAASVLSRRGYLERHEIGCYQLTPHGVAAASAGEVIKCGPRGKIGKVRTPKNTLRQRAWTSMRGRRIFTVQDLIMDASSPDDRDPADNIHRYLRTLSRAGYIATAQHRTPAVAPTSNGQKLFRLVRDTGPKAPIFRSELGVIFDQNLAEAVPCARA